MSKKKVKVKVLKPYKDLQKHRLYYPNETHIVEEERAKELIAAGVAELAESGRTESKKEVETAP